MDGGKGSGKSGRDRRRIREEEVINGRGEGKGAGKDGRRQRGKHCEMEGNKEEKDRGKEELKEET